MTLGSGKPPGRRHTKTPPIGGGVLRCGCSTSLSLRAWGLRVGRAAGLRDLARPFDNRRRRHRPADWCCWVRPSRPVPRAGSLWGALWPDVAGARSLVMESGSGPTRYRSTPAGSAAANNAECFLMVASFVAPVAQRIDCMRMFRLGPPGRCGAWPPRLLDEGGG